MTNTPGPGWHNDPSGRHQLRYFNGQWTDQVADNGVVSTSPLVTMGPTTGWTGQSIVQSVVGSDQPRPGPTWSRKKIIWTVVGIVGVVLVAGVALGGAGGSGSGGTGGSGGSGATASSFATPSDSLCKSIGTGWYAARTFAGGIGCGLDLDGNGDSLTATVSQLQASSTDSFNGVSPSVSDLIKQDEQDQGLLWTERFKVPGYALAGAEPETTGSADAVAYASNGTSLLCGALGLGTTSRDTFISQCAAAFKVLARH